MVRRGGMPQCIRFLPIAGAEESILSIQSEQRQGVRVLHLRGDVDLATVSQLQKALDEAARASRQVVLDCAKLKYIDSKGLSLLADFCKRGVRFVLVTPSPTIRRVLQIMALDKLFPAAPSVEEALNPLAEPLSEAAPLDGGGA